MAKATALVALVLLVISASCQEEENPPCNQTPSQNEPFGNPEFLQQLPNEYSSKQKKRVCNYTMVSATQGSRVELTFHIVELENSWGCYRESLTVYDSNGTAIHKYCGNAANSIVITSSGDNLIISHEFWGNSGFLAEWNEVKENTKRENNSYLITHPNTFYENSEDRLCIEVFSNGQARGNGNFTAKVFAQKPLDISKVETLSTEETTKCLLIKIPKGSDISTAFLEFMGQFENPNFNFRAFKKVNTIKDENFNLIQTDKGQYKPKDTVKFRVLLINNHLMTPNIKRVDEVWVEDAAGRRIEQWRNQPLKRGIIQQQFTLSEEPQLGTWTIHFVADAGKLNGNARFTVAEYVLPKFEVRVEPPAAILRDAINATWRVCGVYTHGASVMGSVAANFSSGFSSDEDKKVQILKKINPGEKCATIVLNRNQLRKVTHDGEYSRFVMKVELEEEETSSKIGTPTKSYYLEDEALKFDKISSSKPFMVGGFPYTGELKVMDHNGNPRSKEELEVCTRLFRDISHFRFSTWGMNEDQILGLQAKIPKLHYKSQCHQRKTDKDGKLKFFVPLLDIPRDVAKLSVNVSALNFPKNETTGMKQPTTKLDVPLIHINSTMSVLFQEKEKLILSCDENFTSKVYFANQPESSFDMYYKIISNGKIFNSDSVNINMGHIDEIDEIVGDAKILTTQPNQEAKQAGKIVKGYNIDIPIDYRLSPKINVVVFMIDMNDTVVSASQEYNVEPCQRHKVTGQWSKEKVYPGSPVSYKIDADTGSFCGLSATDKSVELLGNENKITRERVSQLQTRMNYRKTSTSPAFYAYQCCPQTQHFVQQFGKGGINVVSDLSIIESCQTVRDSLKQPGSSCSTSYNDGDSYGARVSGAAASSAGGPQPQFAEDDSFDDNPEAALFEEPSTSLRSYFPETWLFEFLDVKDDVELNLTSPHSITEWQAELFCISDENGLGVSKSQPLLVSQDFFAELILPYSVKRNEGFPLNISIFNNVARDLPIQVTIKNNAEEVLLGQTRFDLCVSKKSNKIVSIKTTAKKLGHINITVEARITNGIAGCKNVSEGEGFTDALVKPLIVKPEGFPIEKVESEFLCKNDGDSSSEVTMKPLTTPLDTVPDSERAWVYVTGDVMAPSLKNTDNLVNLPMGCGEQNMARLVPNINLLKYLKATGKSEPELERKARSYINIGYIRQQEYRHEDGSYSIWGKGNGSTWLTAFVLKSFSEALPFLSLKYDWESFQQSVDWLMESQKEDGCFLRKGYTYSSSLKGGANEDSLTPFVILALIQVQDSMPINIDDKKFVKAVDCMINSFDIDKIYSASLTTYVSNLLNKKKNLLSQEFSLPLKTKDKIQSLWPEIKKTANTSVPGALFWDSAARTSSYSYSRSKAVEITAYNILTMSLLDQLSDAVQAVKWLARQRNSYGGFVSTQDTVVGLEALSAYTRKVIGYPLDMSIHVEENHLSTSNVTTYRLTPQNALLLQTQKLSNLPNQISVTPSGSGCALVQTVLRYNQQSSPDSQGFSITAQNIDNMALRVCYQYTGSSEKTDMAIIVVELVTGWEAHDLDNLLNDVNVNVQRFEKEEDKVVIYLDGVTKNEECLEMEVKQNIVVENTNTAIIKMYDYYNTEDTTSIQYHM